VFAQFHNVSTVVLLGNPVCFVKVDTLFSIEDAYFNVMFPIALTVITILNV